MSDALDFKTIPKRELIRETMRSCSLHHASSVGPYGEHLSSLQKNAPAVTENWQADASDANWNAHKQPFVSYRQRRHRTPSLLHTVGRPLAVSASQMHH
jgi:hypothetical protein